MVDKHGGDTSLEVAAAFGFLYFSFLVGVKIDMDMILKANEMRSPSDWNGGTRWDTYRRGCSEKNRVFHCNGAIASYIPSSRCKSKCVRHPDEAFCNFRVTDIPCFFIVKLVAIVLPSLYCNIPIQDALSLGLILQCDGTFNLLIFSSMCTRKTLDEKSYAIIVLTRALTTMVSTPVIKCISDPSRSQENVPSIINFLAATNPTKDCSVCIYVLHLVDLVGRAASLLVEHDKQPKQKQLTHIQSHSRVSEKINKAFDKFEQRSQNFTIGQAYTAVAPFAGIELAETPIRAVNQSILQKAPCTVGILFDHINSSKLFYDVPIKRYNVAMIFIGGPDDREALTYSMRIANEPNLRLTVFRFTHSEVRGNNTRETKKDDNLIKELQKKITKTGNIVYKEEDVTDCGDTSSKIKIMEETHNFILVGRQHDNNSPVLLGLDEWCVYKELGVVGDLLVTSNFKGNYSVLIVKQ
ncbi:hypothetical protein C5167_014733 [Papaver somniferum]|uniref:Cation/H(+) antiporter C-terminal domain-containing protein n=1 Tax=Papaver somniferum TaxID=3469 RepID=A0A4Y7J411_PAPSO|nr:hypothetical protein C5167_014733 [Papaver somniferum]